jgi:hypothetical protein
MIRTLLLGATLACGLATVASAGITPAPIGSADAVVIKVAEGCGRGFWRTPDGHCWPMARGRVCPGGYRWAEGGRCWAR